MSVLNVSILRAADEQLQPLIASGAFLALGWSIWLGVAGQPVPGILIIGIGILVAA